MASAEFRKALKTLRTKFNLSQKQVADVAVIKQTDYSAFETGKKKLDLDSANELSSKIWGVLYTEFVSFSKKEIDTGKLPPATREIIKNSKNTILRDSSDFLATELDRLISDGQFNTPTTSKLLHAKMDSKLAKKKTSEITSLLGRPPRNKIIVPIGTYATQKIYVHQEHASQYENLSKEELIKLIIDEEEKVLKENIKKE